MEHESHKRPLSPDDHWRALCYLLEEMSESEREAFEVELAESEALQGALAEAVDLTDALREGRRVPLVATGTAAPSFEEPKSPWRTSATGALTRSWFAAAAAVMILGAVGVWWFNSGAASVVADSGEIALAWAEQLENEAAPLEGELAWDWQGEVPAADGAFEAIVSDGDDVGESWVFSAALDDNDIEFDEEFNGK